ncbi:hypothetical protein [Frondihabitans sp. PAMC 28766]|uniref:hypothetical protein n=1 Tax=Frondihabitans sp. PAMC 28766 TaxID=1795630 RepID=UPI0012FF8067|nr:hypothetical protein [Frondihabitans sp. PAMC 28766]
MLLLPGCSRAIVPDDPRISQDEALIETLPRLEFAQRTVGGKWQNLDLGSQSCTLPSGAVGSMQAATRLGPGVPKADQEAILESIAKDWTRAGRPPIRSKLPVIRGVEVTRLRYPGGAQEDDDVYLEFQIADTATSVDSRTRCVVDTADDDAAEDERNEPAPEPPIRG